MNISHLHVKVYKEDNKCDHVEGLKFQTAKGKTTRNDPCAYCMCYRQYKLNLCDKGQNITEEHSLNIAQCSSKNVKES